MGISRRVQGLAVGLCVCAGLRRSKTGLSRSRWTLARPLTKRGLKRPPVPSPAAGVPGRRADTCARPTAQRRGTDPCGPRPSAATCAARSGLPCRPSRARGGTGGTGGRAPLSLPMDSAAAGLPVRSVGHATAHGGPCARPSVPRSGECSAPRPTVRRATMAASQQQKAPCLIGVGVGAGDDDTASWLTCSMVGWLRVSRGMIAWTGSLVYVTGLRIKGKGRNPPPV